MAALDLWNCNLQAAGSLNPENAEKLQRPRSGRIIQYPDYNAYGPRRALDNFQSSATVRRIVSLEVCEHTMVDCCNPYYSVKEVSHEMGEWTTPYRRYQWDDEIQSNTNCPDQLANPIISFPKTMLKIDRFQRDG